MIQRLLTFILLCSLSLTSIAASTAETSATKLPQKSPEERYLEGATCITQADTACAQVALAGLPTTSPYAKILEAQLASINKDDDTVLRLLIPLQINNNLLPQAVSSLHATLAKAYENQGNPLRALEQLFPLFAENPDETSQKIWHVLKDQPKEALLSLRGESQDTLTQGWIDLALAAQTKNPADAIDQWHAAYPDHPVSAALLAQLSQAPPAVDGDAAPIQGTVAVLLPLEELAYEATASALYTGLMAARGDAQTPVLVYPTHGKKEDILNIYEKAVNDGAQYVIGPMTREEVSALATSGIKLLPTLVLNTVEQEQLPENLMLFGMPVEPEVTQMARIARAYGMQSAMIVAADTPLAKRMVQAFLKEWQVQEGTVTLQKTFSPDTQPAELKADLAGQTADMIFLAANADEARLIRPYLNTSIPTFSTSHIYDGVDQNPENQSLAAIHFVDMPWMINQDHTDFSSFTEAAAKLPPGEAQRWFAIGVDAWHILAAKANGKSLLLPGLSGTLHMEGNTIVRELPMAQFRSEGVVLEPKH
jgi:outer membrane PBP1 activator LpoA protein